MKYRPEDIFTPQGILEEVEKRPNLDFLLNIFNIPRAFGVSGFGGNWNVGKHSYATALIAILWAKHCQYKKEQRDALVTLALTHDLHEAVTGDILPMFKTDSVRKKLTKIQSSIHNSLGIVEDLGLATDLKIVDLIAFLYEIKQVSPSILQPGKLALAKTIANRQTHVLFSYCKEQKVAKDKVQKFLTSLDL